MYLKISIPLKHKSAARVFGAIGVDIVKNTAYRISGSGIDTSLVLLFKIGFFIEFSYIDRLSLAAISSDPKARECVIDIAIVNKIDNSERWNGKALSLPCFGKKVFGVLQFIMRSRKKGGSISTLDFYDIISECVDFGLDFKSVRYIAGEINRLQLKPRKDEGAIDAMVSSFQMLNFNNNDFSIKDNNSLRDEIRSFREFSHKVGIRKDIAQSTAFRYCVRNLNVESPNLVVPAYIKGDVYMVKRGLCLEAIFAEFGPPPLYERGDALRMVLEKAYPSQEVNWSTILTLVKQGNVKK